MKKYLLVWEVNDDTWKVIEKGNFYMTVLEGEDLEEHLRDFSEAMAEPRGIPHNQFIITNFLQIS